jgi:gliding motility-associated-like protein
VAITNSFTSCPDKSFTLNSATSGGYPMYNYSWTLTGNQVSTLANLDYTTPSTGGTYTVEVKVIDSCSYQRTDSEVIVVLPNTLNVSIIDSVSLCGNTTFTLNSLTSGGYPLYSYNWYFTPSTNSISNSSILNSTTPEFEGMYTLALTVMDSCGYQQTDFQVINVLPPCQVQIPNVITPNGDAANEFFKIKNIEYHPNTSITIFDRWGKKVYENPNYNNEWNGGGIADGTFFYIVEVPNDKKYNGFLTVFNGK